MAASRKIKENGAVPLSGLLISGSSSIVYLRVPSVVSRAVPGRLFSRCQSLRRNPRRRNSKERSKTLEECEFHELASPRTARIIHPTIMHNIMNDNYSSSFRPRHARIYLSPVLSFSVSLRVILTTIFSPSSSTESWS